MGFGLRFGTAKIVEGLCSFLFPILRYSQSQWFEKLVRQSIKSFCLEPLKLQPEVFANLNRMRLKRMAARRSTAVGLIYKAIVAINNN